MATQMQPQRTVAIPKAASRLAHIDWMRGLACVLMFQWHCYNSWLSPEARKSTLYLCSQLGGTLPAPLFLFLTGVSSALVTGRLRQKGTPRNAIAKTTMRRGAEIFALGLLFRVQEFVLGYPGAPWTDLLRVDILNTLGLSIILLSVMCWLTARDLPVGAPNKSPAATRRAILVALAVATLVALLTPLVWTTRRLDRLPWPLESYINGVHIFHQPQPWLFPLFPWVAFAFLGLAVGLFSFSDFARRQERRAFFALGVTGVLAGTLAVLFDLGPVRLYPPAMYDYWHTSPNFFLLRCAVLLVILFSAYAWSRVGWAQRGFSPLIQLGKTSLLVYWAHIEFVYGRFSILPKGRCNTLSATAGLLAIFLAMLTLSILRTRWKRRPAKVSPEQPAPATATAESG